MTGCRFIAETVDPPLLSPEKANSSSSATDLMEVETEDLFEYGINWLVGLWNGF
jgi:hypothetical protein